MITRCWEGNLWLWTNCGGKFVSRGVCWEENCNAAGIEVMRRQIWLMELMRNYGIQEVTITEVNGQLPGIARVADSNS